MHPLRPLSKFKSLLPFLVLGIALFLFDGRALAQYDSLKSQLAQANLSPRSWDLLAAEMKKESYGKEYAAIVDYSLPASQPRFFLINLKTKSFQIMHVSHGWNSGGEEASCFSNKTDSYESSLGFEKTSAPAQGAWKPSVILKGISASNSNMESRHLILHSADYSSEAFLQQNGYWGRSQGCLAMPQADIKTVMDSLGSNALILSYHDKLWDQSQKYPNKPACLPGAKPRKIPPNPWEVTENKMGSAFKSVRGRYEPNSGTGSQISRPQGIH